MIGRERELALAIDLIVSGRSVDVVGVRGSGRTAFLNALRARLEEIEWTVLSVRGVASLRAHPLGALYLAGIGSPSPQGITANLIESSTALRKATQSIHSVLFVDDWDDLDESSWGVIESVRRSTGVPTVLSRLHGLDARHTPSGLHASTLEPSYVVELNPLSFNEMESATVQYLDAPVEANTMNRIFARSGGNIGLAIALVDACRREDRLVRTAEGEWQAIGVLWSPGLSAVIEAHLESLTEEARDALEIIALIGLTGLDTVRKLVDWETLETLEKRALITLVPSGEQQIVAVIPPLLAEFFRHEPIATRRIRLTEYITERLGSGETRRMLLADATPRPNDPLEQDALFVRLLQENAQTQLLITRAEWDQNHSARAAVRYVHALSQLGAEREQIEEVFAETDCASATPEQHAHFVLSRGNWMANDPEHTVENVIEYFSQERDELGEYGRLLDAAEVRILVNMRAVPEDFANTLEVTDDLPAAVKLALLQSQLMVLVCLGRFTDAQRVFTEIEKLDRAEEAYMAQAFHALALIGAGDLDLALCELTRGLDEARSNLDLETAYTFAAGVALCEMLAGDYAAVDKVLDTFLATLNPLPFIPTVQLTLHSIAAVVSLRRGNIALGERYLQDIENGPLTEGAFPTQSLSWAQAQLQSFNGETALAAKTLWNLANTLWERGARFSASLAYLSALELQPDAKQLKSITERLAEVDGLFVPAYQAYVSALIAEDTDAMVDAFEKLRSVGLTGVALSSLRHAASWARTDGAETRADKISQLEEQYFADQEITSVNTMRFTATALTLTDREREVAELAAEGLSNQEIATRLVLSMRTVETHMHRIMRKLDISSRQALRQYFS